MTPRNRYPECCPSRLTLIMESKSMLGEMYRQESLAHEAFDYLVSIGRTPPVPVPRFRQRQREVQR